jgi:ribosomal protein S18
MALNSRLFLRIPRMIRPLNVRFLKTTTTEHPEPVYDQDEKVLEKVLESRGEDVPSSLKNPYAKERRKCILCEHGLEPDYKNVKLLSQFVSPYTGMLYGRHITGLCKEKQARVEKEVIKSTSYGFMATYLKEVEFLKDPKLCDPERPIRPHKY